MLYESETANQNQRWHDHASRLFYKIACALSTAWLRYKQWRVESEAIRHLNEADEHTLWDIGIHRWEIRDRVRGNGDARKMASISRLCRRDTSSDTGDTSYRDAA